MKKYVFPPQMDWIHNKELTPFAMYVFEFSHRFDKQDLADMWQNVMPDSGHSFDTAIDSISHGFLANHMLSGGKLVIDRTLEEGLPVPNKLQWMVFKVKQRAQSNYYGKIAGETSTIVPYDPGETGTSTMRDFEDRRFAKWADEMMRVPGYDADVNFNWPYDYFSIVELAKLDCQVQLADKPIPPHVKYRPKRGKNPMAGLPPRARERAQASQGGGGGGEYFNPDPPDISFCG